MSLLQSYKDLDSDKKWDFGLRILFAVIGAIFTLIVFSVAEAQKTAADASALRDSAEAALKEEELIQLRKRQADSTERTSILGSETLVRAFVDSDQSLACNAFLALSSLSKSAHDEGLEHLPRQVDAILRTRPNFVDECKIQNLNNSGATTESYDAAVFRVQTSVDPVIESSDNDGWYAIALSLKTSTPNALARATAYSEQLENGMSALSQRWQIQVWHVLSNGFFAVTVGPSTTQEKAEDIASVLRREGLVLDAFAQDHRDWELVSQTDTEKALETPQPLAGFRIFVHLPTEIDSRAMRSLLLDILEAEGATVAGFDNITDRFGGGVDYSAGSTKAENAARTIATLLLENSRTASLLETIEPRPQSAISNERTIGLWVEAFQTQ